MGKKMIKLSLPSISRSEIKAVTKVITSGDLAQGLKVEEFESKFAKYIGTRYAIAVSNGTIALHVALLANKIGPGDEVITSPLTFVATANAIKMTGATPIFVDIGDDYNIDVSKIKEKITEKTRAILPVHLYGNPCDMTPIMELAETYNLKIIEDACQAHGAEYNRRKVGSFGTGCFSFYATKNMTTGEGGMITTNDPAIKNMATILRHHGTKEILGYNYRLTDIQAALGVAQLKRLDEFTTERLINAKYYLENLNKEKIVLPKIEENKKHVFHQFTIRVKNRTKIFQQLIDMGIESRVYYPEPIEALPKVTEYCNELLSIPVRPGLIKEETEYIANTLNKIIK